VHENDPPTSVSALRHHPAVLSRASVLSRGWAASMRQRRRRQAASALLARYGPRAGKPSLRVVVLTAEVGEGHAAAARALAADLVAERADVEVLVCDALVGLGRFLRYALLDAYRWQLSSAPWMFDLPYRLVSRVRLLRGLGRAGLALFGARPLCRLIDAYRPDVVVSTYPAATSVVGCLRRRRKLSVPACATVTDLGGLEFWVHPGIDLHLVMHTSCVAPIEREAGLGSVRRVRPLVAPAFFMPCSRATARHALGLPSDRPVVVVSGGGWGVGDLEGAVRTCLDLPTAIAVCVTGRNECLRERLDEAFANEPRVRILGFTERMSELLAAADALVHSTGGVTCLEALVRGCPIVAYGAPRGHARLTARVMTSVGLLRSANSRAQLGTALARALTQPVAQSPRLEPAPSAGSLVLSAEPRVRWARERRRPVPRLAAASAATMLAFGSWAFLSDDAYPIVARTLDLEPVSTVATERPQVGLVIRAPAPLVPRLVGVLGTGDAHASFAFTATPGRGTLRTLRSARDQPLPELRHGGLVHWLHTRGELTQAANAFGLSKRFYLGSWLTTSQYLLGRDVGAVAIVGSVHIGPGSRVSPSTFHRGDVIVLTLGPGAREAGQTLERLLDGLARRRLTPVSFGRLTGASA
jgi:processive 1,2-diacylglycerol beta-glucosyltransferase